MGGIEVKVKKLDNELATYKAQMAKLRDGPGKVSARERGVWSELVARSDRWPALGR